MWGWGVVLVALLLPVVILASGEREAVREISSPYVNEVVVSDRDVTYPLRDVLVFDYRPDEVFVYVSVAQMPERTKMSASVERSGRGSVFSRIFGQNSLSVEEVASDLIPTGRSAETVSGVVKLRVRDSSGNLRAGGYTVVVRADGETAATRGFEVERF